MRWLVGLCLSAIVLPALIGCRNSCDRVESELRAREQDVRILREELQNAHFYNQLLLRQMQAYAGLPGPDGVVPALSEPYPVRSIRFGRQTGGRPSETLPGDDALQVQLEPIDPEGQAIKAPGHLLLQAIEINPEGLKRPLSVWEIPADQLRENWRNGLFTTGYLLTLPWKVWPSTERLRLIALFRMVDGRCFEADKDITVRVLPEYKRKLETPANPNKAIVPSPEKIPPMPRSEGQSEEPPPVKKSMPPADNDATPPPFPPPPPTGKGSPPAGNGSTLPSPDPIPPPPPPPPGDGPALMSSSANGPTIRLLKPIKMVE
jgi:hypothetical protein